jgi:4'-phosphopantetheinyl transferase
MVTPGWLSRCLAEVPAGDEWLGAAERRAQGALGLEQRRRDWRLGRWTAKLAVGTWLAVPPERVQILAADDGAPEAWLDGERARVSVSLSHRAGRALAAVAGAPSIVGCDLELVEPRSAAFVEDWLTAAEQDLLVACGAEDRARLANLVWAAKEAAAKVRREGLRLDLRHAAVTPTLAGVPDGSWCALRVGWRDRARATAAWWRVDGRCVMAIAGEPALGRPRLLGSPIRGAVD